jgi:hypothetical protein
MNLRSFGGMFETFQELWWTEGVIWRKREGLSVKLGSLGCSGIRFQNSGV